MDKNADYSNFYGMGGFSPYQNNPYDCYDNPNIDFNPMMQYEQGYMYYRYLTQQLEYKIKCKEYEKVTNLKDSRQDRRVE